MQGTEQAGNPWASDHSAGREETCSAHCQGKEGMPLRNVTGLSIKYFAYFQYIVLVGLILFVLFQINNRMLSNNNALEYF